MVPTAFDEENGVLDGPAGTTSEECAPLSVWRGPLLPEGTPVVVSCWKPTAEEMAEIVRTGRVWVMIWGHTMPPICPMGTSPFQPSPPFDPTRN